MATTRRKKVKTSNLIFLYSIFFITTLVTSYVYVEHANVELEAYENAKTETKKIKTLGESLLFSIIGFGYLFTGIFMFLKPRNLIPYLVIIIGTIAVVILYYFRIYGIPIPFTEIVIVDFSSDWRDVITKICQQILVVPTSVLLMMRKSLS
jgi:hypothetical protein